MAANTNMIVKITDGKDIRRFTTSTQNLTYAALHKHASESFGVKKFKLMYRDDEGDQITMSTDAEISEAIGLTLKLEPPVLRLTLVPNNTNSRNASPEKERATTDDESPELATLFKNIKKQLPTLLEHLPSSVKANLENLDLAASIAATADAAAEAINPATNPDMEGYHPGVTCDKTGQNPLVGMRYHLKGHNWDLCATEFDKLPDSEKAQFEAIEPTVFRCKPKGTERQMGFHPGVTCDKSGQCPIFGWRFHLKGENYDLCESEFNKLPDEEKPNYEKIAPPQQCWGRGGWGRGGKGGWGGGWAAHGGKGGWGGGWDGAGGWAGAWSHGGKGKGFGKGGEHEHGGKGKGKGCGGKGGEREDGGAPCHKQLAARFVCDVSIFDGTQMAPGTKFTKIWRLKNTGEVPWPPGTQILFVGGDQMSSALTVPLSRQGPVAPGEEVDVTVDLVAPQEHGRYVGYWRLTGPMGRKKWGQRVWTHIHVVDPQVEPQPPTEKEMAEIEAAVSNRAKDDGAEDPAEPDASEAPAPAPTLSEVENYILQRMRDDEDDPHPPHSSEAPMAETSSDDGEMVIVNAADTTTVTAMMQAATVDDASNGAAASDEPMPPAPAATAAGAEPAASESPSADVAKKLGEMGFYHEAELVQYVIEKNGPNVDACARDLSNLNTWGEGLTDLLEMGFENSILNAKLMIKNGGSVKNTVRDLVSDDAP